MYTERLNLSRSHGSPPPLTHLRGDHAADLTSIPEKYLESNDLAVLKPFQTALRKQSLGQPVGGMEGIQFPAGRGPTMSGSQPHGPANVCRALPPRSYPTVVKDLWGGRRNRSIHFKEGRFFQLPWAPVLVTFKNRNRNTYHVQCG